MSQKKSGHSCSSDGDHGPSSSRRPWTILLTVTMGRPPHGDHGPSSSRRPWTILLTVTMDHPPHGDHGPSSSR
uniref:Uncharacterized protein n=1 Tax=Knipowitschia caucasica TaxID=637954 RepID=A0AAV2LX60_KNICA